MEPDDLVVGELYLIQDYSSDRCSPHFKRLYAGKPVLYLGIDCGTKLARYGCAYKREPYKLLIDGEIHYMPENFLRHLQKVLDNPFEPC